VNQKLKNWMQLATVSEQTELAKAAHTSRGQLYQLSSGQRSASPLLARRIELASKAVNKRHPHLPLLLRAELCPACGECEYARKHCAG
jgi:RNase P subunit RPR2